MSAFPELRASEWASVEHAYGAAVDTPAQLEALAQGDAKARRSALAKLAETLHHQTETYPASAKAVPFLIALVCDASYPDRIQLLELLAGLAVGEPDPVRGFDLRTVVGRAQLEARDGGLLTYEAVASQLPKLATLLSDPLPEVRRAAAFVLSEFADHADELLHLVRVALRSDSDEAARASLLLCLRLLAKAAGDRTDVPELEARVARGNPAQSDAVAAAIARLDVAGPHAPSLALLREAKKNKKAAGFFWGDTRLIGRWVIDGLDLDRPTSELIREIEDPAGTHERKRSIALRLLPRLLTARKGSYLLPDELNPDARRVLIASVKYDLYPSTELDVFFDARGVPPHYEHRYWLGLEPPDRLERVAKFEGHEWPIWKWLHASLKGEIAHELALRAVAATLDADDRVELVHPSEPSRSTPSWSREGKQLTYRYNLCCRYDALGPDDDFGIKRREERLDALAAAILGTCDLETLVPLGRRYLAGPTSASVRSLVAAIGRLARARGDPFPPDLQPLWERSVRPCEMLRDAFASLPLDARQRVIDAWGFEHEEILEPSPSGPVPKIVFLDAWTVADLCPTREVARSFVGAILEWRGPESGLAELVERAVRLGDAIRQAVAEALALPKNRKNPGAKRLDELRERLDRG